MGLQSYQVKQLALLFARNLSTLKKIRMYKMISYDCYYGDIMVFHIHVPCTLYICMKSWEINISVCMYVSMIKVMGIKEFPCIQVSRYVSMKS